jgi:peptide/nickel transport system permease protein
MRRLHDPGESATQDAVAALQQKLGLNDPPVQHWHWFSKLLQGDLDGPWSWIGLPHRSFSMRWRVRRSSPVSFVLVVSIGITCGVHAATHRGKASDWLLALMQFLFISVPDFFWAILAVLVFAAFLQWLPRRATSRSTPRGVIGCCHNCAACAGISTFGLIAHVSRLTRSSMLEVRRAAALRRAARVCPSD